ncbi:MAG: BatD family protein, partial [Planctomycetota bacterium]
MKVLHTLTLLLLSLQPLTAAEPALVRSKLVTEEIVWVGQKVVLVVELLAEGRFAGTPKFELPNLPGVVIFKPAERPQLSTETIGETSYTVQRHEFAIFAQRAGPVVIPAFKVRFSAAAGFVGVEPKDYGLKTSEHRFDAKMPPGAEELATIISTRDLVVEEQWEPEPGEGAKVGDAFTRSVTFRAPDVPGMAFPPLPSMEIEGLGIYAKAPMVRDRTERGEFTGERVEKVTYVFERHGPATLPAIVIHWWDLDAEELKRVELPGNEFMVKQSVVAKDEWGGETSYAFYVFGALLVLLLLGGGAIFKYRATVLERLAAWRARRDEREAAYFKRVMQACQSRDPKAALNALMRWIDRIDEASTIPTLSEFIKRCSDLALEHEVNALQDAALQEQGEWQGAPLAAVLGRFRKKSKRVAARVKTNPLPALNPLESPRAVK